MSSDNKEKYEQEDEAFKCMKEQSLKQRHVSFDLKIWEKIVKDEQFKRKKSIQMRLTANEITQAGLIFILLCYEYITIINMYYEYVMSMLCCRLFYS